MHFPSCLIISALELKREILPKPSEENNRVWEKRVEEWAEMKREVLGCLSEGLCTLTHTYKHTSQPLPLTPSCTAA